MREVRRVELIAAIGTPCRYCGEPMDAPTRDHILPRSQGGRLGRRNKALVCDRCNSDKRGRTLLAWLEKLEREGDRRASVIAAIMEAQPSLARQKRIRGQKRWWLKRRAGKKPVSSKGAGQRPVSN